PMLHCFDHCDACDVGPRWPAGTLAPEAGKAFQWLLGPGAGTERDVEVDALRRLFRIDHAIGQRALDSRLLEVGGALGEYEGRFHVVKRNLGYSGGEWREPVRNAGAAPDQPAVAVPQDELVRLGSQMGNEAQWGNGCHSSSSRPGRRPDRVVRRQRLV